MVVVVRPCLSHHRSQRARRLRYSRAARRYVVFVVCMVFRGLLGVRLLWRL